LADDANSNNNNNGNNNGLGVVELRIDDDVDAKLGNMNLPKPNITSAKKTNQTDTNTTNKNGVVWGKSAIAKESDKSELKPNSIKLDSGKLDASKNKSDSKSTPDVRFVQTPLVQTQPENQPIINDLKNAPAPKTASKINQHYAELPITTPKPLPQPQNKTKQTPTPTTPETPTPKHATTNKPIANATYNLKSARVIGSVDLVETLLEVTGDVKQPAGNEKQKNTTEKMEVVAGFRYEERLCKSQEKNKSLLSVRQYNLAKAKMKIGKDLKTPELKGKTRTIVSRLDGDKVSLFSPNGALRGEELLLVEDLPGNTLTLDRLLPDKEVKVGDSWQISDAQLRSFLSIDAVTESRVEAVFTAVADDVAMVEIVGEVQGIYLGAETKMTIQAKYQFDLSARRINWLGILIQEDRSVGHVGPGFNLIARLQVKISPLEKPQHLTDEFISSINTAASENVLGLKYDGGKGAWRFAHDRNWYVFQDDAQTTVLRRLYNGELVAQCNIADMGTVDINTMTTLEKFKNEISSGLGKSYRKIVAADQYVNDAGYKVYSVMIDGAVDDLPLRWVYNLLTDQDGRQSVVVFVIEAKMLKIFGNSDDMLLNTYRMIKK
jgi:hypothetical protein